MSSIGTIIENAITMTKNDALAKAAPLLAAFFTSISQNPSALNVINQLTVLNVQLVALGPVLGQEVLTDIANSLNAQVQAMVAAAAKPA